MAEPSPSSLPARQPERRPPALVTRSLSTLEADLGGRAQLVAALAQAPKTRDLEYVLGLIGDPSNAHLSLAEICAQGGVTAGEVLDAARAGFLLRAQVVSAKVVSERLPVVVEELMTLAGPHTDPCHTCQGTATIVPEPSPSAPNPLPVPCPVCAGRGELLYPGDLDHKKLALEVGRLTARASGPSVAVDARSIHLGGGRGSGEAAGGSLEQLMLATDRLLYGDGRPGPLPPGPQPAAAEVEEEEPSEPPVDGEILPPAPADPDPAA